MATPPPRRVMLFVFDLSATGVVRNALAIAGALAADAPVTLVACRASGTFAASAPPGVEIVALGADGRLRLVGAALRLRAWVKANRPLVAISAGNRGHPLFLPALAGLRGVRRIYRFSNDIDHRRDGREPRLLVRVANAAQLAALRHSADCIVAVSPVLLEHPGLAAARRSGQAVVIENGVDIARVRALAALPCPHPWASDGGPPFVLGIGRLVAQKNFARLVEAVAQARQVRPLRLMILGDGPERAAVAALAAAHRLGSDFSLPGVAANPFGHMAAAAVFALPSWWEGASNVLLEALACGTPVVASPSAGNAANVLDGGRYGLLADPGDTAAWAAALLRQTGPADRRVVPGDRAAAFRIEDTLAAWRRLVAAAAAR